jgi:hypothetical protein
MKSRLCPLLFLAIAPWGPNARAQDGSQVQEIKRSVDAVDPSLHADVQERNQTDQQDPRANRTVRPQTYSRWVLSATDQSPTVSAWPSQTSETPTKEQGEQSGVMVLYGTHWRVGQKEHSPDIWSVLSEDSSAFRTRLESDRASSKAASTDPAPVFIHDAPFAQPDRNLGTSHPQNTLTFSMQPEDNGLSSPFSAKEFGLNSDFSSETLSSASAFGWGRANSVTSTRPSEKSSKHRRGKTPQAAANEHKSVL